MIKKLHIPGGESDGKEWDDWAGKPGALLLAPCGPHLAWEYPHVSCRKDGKCWGSQGNSRIKRLIWEGSSCRSRWLGSKTSRMGTRTWPGRSIWDQPLCSDYQLKMQIRQAILLQRPASPRGYLRQEPSNMHHRFLRKEETALWNMRIYPERPSHPKYMLCTSPTGKLDCE